MKKIIALLFVLFYVLNSAKSQEITIKLNLNLCSNCYMGYGLFNELPESIPLTIIVGEKSKRSAKFEIKNYVHINRTYSLISSDSLYDKVSSDNDSEVFLYMDSVLVSRILMVDFISNFSLLKPLFFNKSDSDEKILEFPDTCDFSRRATVLHDENLIYVTDAIYKKIAVQNLHDSSVHIFSLKDIEMKSIYSKLFNDTSLYYYHQKYHDILVQTNNAEIKVQNSRLIDSILYVLVDIPTLKMKEENRLIIGKRLALFGFYDDQMVEQILVGEIEGSDYFGFNDFFKYDEDWYISIINALEDSGKVNFLGKYECHENLLVFKDTVMVSLPEFYVKNNLYYNLFKYVKTDNYLLINLVNKIIDLDSLCLSEYPIVSRRFRHNKQTFELDTDLNLSDAKKEGSIFSLLSYDTRDEEYKYSLFDLKRGIVYFDRFPLKRITEARPMNVGLWDLTHIYYIDGNEVKISAFSIE